MKKIFKSNLMRDVIISYICLIVLPIMTILVIAFILASKNIYNAAADSISVTQNAILDLYQEEKHRAAISLSHVVNMNDGITVEQVAGDNEEQKEVAREQLNTMYQLLAAPEYKLLDIHIYRKDGRAIIPRSEMRYSVEELREKEWYQKALAQPGEVQTYLEEEDYFYRIRSAQEMLVVAAIAPRSMPEVECIVLYQLSQVPETIKKYNKNSGTGESFVIRAEDYLAVSFDHEDIRYIVNEMSGSGCYLVNAVNERDVFGQFRMFSTVCLVVIFCVVMMFIAYFRWYMNRLLVPLHNLTKGMIEVEHHNLNTKVEMCKQQDIAKMVSVFNNMVVQIVQLIHEKEQVEKDKYQEELLALQSQMNPHFLMNTLNTLKFMAISTHHDGMRDMVTALENILAAVLNRDGGFYTVKEEESVLNSYIYIMKFRYMESFDVDIKINSDVKECKVPKLILQPIVENSIVHGFDGLLEGYGKVEILGRVTEGDLEFVISDNGKGMEQKVIDQILKGSEIDDDHEPGKTEYRTIGISNTNRRLKLNFGEQYGVTIKSELGTYTQITIKMPVIRTGDTSDV